MSGHSTQSHVQGVRLTQYADKPGADQRLSDGDVSSDYRSEIHGVTDVIMSRTMVVRKQVKMANESAANDFAH